MTLNDIYGKLERGEIDVQEAFRLSKLHRKGDWLDRLLAALVA